MRAIAILISIIALGLTSFNVRDDRLEVGDLFPDITLKNQEDVEQSLYASSGEVTVVYFWATCCKEYKKVLSDVLDPVLFDYADNGLKIYTVAQEQYQEKWKAYMQAKNFKGVNTCCSDWDCHQGKMSKSTVAWGNLYLLNKDHKVLARYHNLAIYDHQLAKLENKLKELFPPSE